jgi:aspartyl/asparaginyl beta-hydroxylase (cupin superfamily)
MPVTATQPDADTDRTFIPPGSDRPRTASLSLDAQDKAGSVISFRPAEGFVARAMRRAVEIAERLNLAYPKIPGNPMVYTAGSFPWEAGLERATPAILAELNAVLKRQVELPSLNQIVRDVELLAQPDLWKTFLLCGYGIKSERNIAACPQTWAAVRGIPGLKTAMFSIMEPGTHLAPHRGPYNGVLRVHLGLIIPEPPADVAIRVGDTLCHWQTGKVVVFDDAYEHEAWNHSDITRVVLFLDFVKPLRFPASGMNWLLLNLAMFSSFVREGADNQNKWEKKFYQQ